MNEQIVKFKTAILAKKAEFDCQVYHCYKVSTEELYEYNSISINTEDLIHTMNRSSTYVFPNGKNYNGSKYSEFMGLISAPTQTILQKWLREKHNIHIAIIFTGDDNYRYEVYEYISNNLEFVVEAYESSYEDALEEALQESLKYIIGRK